MPAVSVVGTLGAVGGRGQGHGNEKGEAGRPSKNERGARHDKKV